MRSPKKISPKPRVSHEITQCVAPVLRVAKEAIRVLIIRGAGASSMGPVGSLELFHMACRQRGLDSDPKR